MNLLKLTGETSQLLCLQALAISDFTVATEMDFGLPCPEWASFMSRLNGVVAAEGLGRTGGGIWIYRGGASSITWSDAASSEAERSSALLRKAETRVVAGICGRWDGPGIWRDVVSASAGRGGGLGVVAEGVEVGEVADQRDHSHPELPRWLPELP